MDWLLWIIAVVALVTVFMMVGFFVVQARIAWTNRRRPRRALSSREREILEPFFPALDLKRVRLIEDAHIWGIRSIAGITFGRRVYLSGRIDSTSPIDLSLLLHELRHVEQYARRTQPLFAICYLWGYVLHGFRYARIPLERDAFAFEARHRDALVAAVSALPDSVP